MNTAEALRYLLLRHIKSVSSALSESSFLEISQTLRVKKEKGNYVIVYKKGGSTHTLYYPEAMFEFYRRGDLLKEEEGLAGTGIENNKNAVAIINDIIGKELPLPVYRQEKLIPHPLYQYIERILFIAIAVLGGGLGIHEAAILSLIFFAEFLKYGILLSSLLLCILAFYLPGAVLLSSFTFLILNFFEPSDRYRRLKYLLLFIAIMISYTVCMKHPLQITALFFPYVAFSLSYFIMRSLYGIHFYLLYFLYPFFFAGLILEGRFLFPWVGIFFCLFSLLMNASLHRIFPVQKYKCTPLIMQ